MSDEMRNESPGRVASIPDKLRWSARSNLRVLASARTSTIFAAVLRAEGRDDVDEHFGLLLVRRLEKVLEAGDGNRARPM